MAATVDELDTTVRTFYEGRGDAVRPSVQSLDISLLTLFK